MAGPEVENKGWDLISTLAEEAASASNAFLVGAKSPEITGFSRAGTELLPESVNGALDSRIGAPPFGPALRTGLGALGVLYEKATGTPGAATKAYESGRDETVAARNEMSKRRSLAVQLGSAIGDVPREIYRAGEEAVRGVGENLFPASLVEGGRNPLTESQFEGFKRTGKGLLSIPAVPLSLVTGTARSVVGHPMAAAEHGLHFLIDREAAAKEDPRKIFEDWRGNVDTAMSAARPAGGAVPQVGPQLTPRLYETPTSPLVWDHSAGQPAPVAPKPPRLTRQELAEVADNGFKKAAAIPLEVEGSAVRSMIGNIRRRLENDMSLAPELTPATRGILDRSKASSDGAPFTGANFEEMRGLLTEAAKSSNVQDARAARFALAQLAAFRRDMPEGAVLAGEPAASAAAYTRAFGDEAAARKSGLAEEIRKGSTGDNAGRSIQDNAKDILNNAEKLKSYDLSTEELKQLRLVANGAGLGKMSARVNDLLTRYGLGANAAGAGVGAGIGYIVDVGVVPGGTIGAAVPQGVLKGAREIANASFKRHLDGLDNTFRESSPHYQAMLRSAQRSRHRTLGNLSGLSPLRLSIPASGAAASGGPRRGDDP
jgi:hypothetical protein